MTAPHDGARGDKRKAHAEDLAEQGRRLASEREDLIAAGVDPNELVVPLHPITQTSGAEGAPEDLSTSVPEPTTSAPGSQPMVDAVTGRPATAYTPPEDLVPAAAELTTAEVHPEDYCHRCGGPNISWYTPGGVWDPVMRADGKWKWNEIICPLCFVELADGADTWALIPSTADGERWTSADERAQIVAEAEQRGAQKALREYADLCESRETYMARRTKPSAADGREKNVWNVAKHELRARADRIGGGSDE